MKIAIIGYFGYRNVGDDLLLQGICDYIKSINKDCIITVFGNAKNINNLVGNTVVVKKKNPFLILMDIFFNEDALVIGPGGLFPSKKTVKIIFYLLALRAVKIKKGIGIGIGVGIGTGNFKSEIDIWLLEKMFNASKVFVIRQKIPNIRGVLGCEKRGKLVEAADIILSKKVLQNIDVEKKNRKVVISLANIFGSNHRYKEEFVDEIVRFIKKINREGYEVKLVAFSNESDQAINDEVAEKVNTHKCVSMKYEEDPKVAVNEIFSSQYVVGMRFHSVIISIRAGIPCCAIAYSDKTEDIMCRLGLEKYCVRFGISEKEYFNEKKQIAANDIMEMFMSLTVNEKFVINQINKKKEELCDLADLNFYYINKYLNEETR